MVSESFEVCGRILTEDISDFMFIFIRSPEVTYVCGLSLSHVIQAMIQSFFFGDKPFVHF